MTGIDRELLRDLDRHLRGPQQAAPPTAQPDEQVAATTRADISGVLEAIQFAAASMSALAERVEQLEAHSRAFEAANNELEEQNRQLAEQLGEAIRQRDGTEESLKAEQERIERLEVAAAQHVTRANALEHDLVATRTGLSKVVELVRSSLGAPA